MVSGYIKKQKYVYYSCHNSKRICTKKIVKEEHLLKTLLNHLDEVALTNEQITKVANYIEHHETEEHMSLQRLQ